tara:strand:+ start:148 stop:249 length:102 start_codon:yes stop_codon:yes gene_type:complete
VAFPLKTVALVFSKNKFDFTASGKVEELHPIPF